MPAPPHRVYACLLHLVYACLLHRVYSCLVHYVPLYIHTHAVI
jgi:hypothetical protein